MTHRNGRYGIQVKAGDVDIANAYVGVLADGRTPAGNNLGGISLNKPHSDDEIRVGDAEAGPNGLVVVSGNGKNGVAIYASNVKVVNVFIGVGADGITAV